MAKNSDRLFLNGVQITTLLLSMVLICIIGLVVYDGFKQSTTRMFITVDVETIMNTKMAEIQGQLDTLEEQEVITLSRNWATQLSREIERLSIEHNAIVLTRPAVISGSVDFTDQILKSMQ